jgi:hypothetical protein
MGTPRGQGPWRPHRGDVGKGPHMPGVSVSPGTVPAPTDGKRRGGERLAEDDEGGAGPEHRREERAQGPHA